jgi:hypothetical protein
MTTTDLTQMLDQQKRIAEMMDGGGAVQRMLDQQKQTPPNRVQSRRIRTTGRGPESPMNTDNQGIIGASVAPRVKRALSH